MGFEYFDCCVCCDFPVTDSIGDHYHPYVVYTYTPDRSGAGPAAIFQGFEGYLQADAYSAYDALFTPL